MELDAEQSAYIRKHHIDPHEAIDFLCSPDFASFYAGQGLTTDYPPEYYRNQCANDARRQADDLSRRLSIIEQRNLSGPATKQEVYELKHLLKKLTERVNQVTKRTEGY